MDTYATLSDKIRAEIFRVARGKECAAREAREAPTLNMKQNANRAWALLMEQELFLREVLDEVVELEGGEGGGDVMAGSRPPNYYPPTDPPAPTAKPREGTVGDGGVCMAEMEKKVGELEARLQATQDMVDTLAATVYKPFSIVAPPSAGLTPFPNTAPSRNSGLALFSITPTL